MTSSTLPAPVATPNPRARILLVGELNPFGADPRAALCLLPRESSGNRLRVIMGISDAAYLSSLDRVNLCDDRWSPWNARERAAWVRSRNRANHAASVFVLLGARVRAAFLVDREERDFLRVVRQREGSGFGFLRLADGSTVACLPHPSGRCRAWNDPGSLARARSLLAAAAPEVRWGSLPVAAAPEGTTS